MEKRMKNVEKWINELIEKNELWRFYKSRDWISLRDKVLKENHNECAICKANGIIKRYDVDADGKGHLIKTVHHINHVRQHPELALSRYYYQQGEKKENLIVVCKACHNKQHPEKFKHRRKQKNKNSKKFMNEEKW